MITVNITMVAGGFIASVATTGGKVESKPCTSWGFAMKSLRGVTKKLGLQLPPNEQLNIVRPADSASAIQFTDSSPAITPDTTRTPAPALESDEEPEAEPELNRLLKPVEGLISPVDQPERWVAIYRGIVARFGSDPQLVMSGMKSMNCVSPWARDAADRPFHMYSDNSLVPAPRPGEGERRQLRNANGYNRDFMGRTPIEPGSLARDTDAFHPANKPERSGNRPMSKEARKEAGKLENANLRANDPAGLEAKQLASRLASQASKSAGGDTIAYKSAFVAVCTALGAERLEKCKKFANDLQEPVSAQWLNWAKQAIAASKAA